MPWKNEPELTRPQTGGDSTPELSPQPVRLENENTSENTSGNTSKGSVSIPSAAIDSTIGELIKELKRKRRWGLALKSTGWIVVIGLLCGIYFGQQQQIIGDHAALVRLEGVIAQGYDASAEDVLAGLKNAFEADNAKGVILAINSPGGSPVQSDMLYQEIKRLTNQFDKPLIAVISDIGASGGYYAAVAAQTIYANPSSIVGSIGVLMNGFGFVELMDKLGVERRLITSGSNKGSLDPFSPMNEDQLRHAKSVINGVHETFIDVVRESRGSKLKETDTDLFSGQFWNGQQAYELGLIDGLKNQWSAAREDIGQETIVDYTVMPDVLERFTQTLGVSIASQLKLYLGETLPRFQ